MFGTPCPSEAMRYHSVHLQVFDGNQRLVCECVDEATAQRIAAALTDIAGYELEHIPRLPEDFVERMAALRRFAVKSDAVDPDFSSRVRKYLRDAVRVLSAATDFAEGDFQRALYWFRNQSIQPLDHKTAEALVAERRMEQVLEYIGSLNTSIA